MRVVCGVGGRVAHALWWFCCGRHSWHSLGGNPQHVEEKSCEGRKGGNGGFVRRKVGGKKERFLAVEKSSKKSAIAKFNKKNERH